MGAPWGRAAVSVALKTLPHVVYKIYSAGSGRQTGIAHNSDSAGGDSLLTLRRGRPTQ